MNDWSTCTAIESNPGKVSGAWVFRGTRVPVTALFNNLKDGATIRRVHGVVPRGDPPPDRSGSHPPDAIIGERPETMRILLDHNIPRPPQE